MISPGSTKVGETLSDETPTNKLVSVFKCGWPSVSNEHFKSVSEDCPSATLTGFTLHIEVMS